MLKNMADKKIKEEKKQEAVVQIQGVDIIKELQKLQKEVYEIRQLVKNPKGDFQEVAIINILKKLQEQIYEVKQLVKKEESEIELSIPPNKIPEEAKTTTLPEIPVPLEYRQIVNEVLNDKFGIKIEPLSDRPQFNLIIIVPEEYSTMSAEEKDMYKQDLRSKVLSYADGVNGVRGYVELVFNSFNPTIQAKIRI